MLETSPRSAHDARDGRPNVLVLSAHAGTADRRIVAETNALVRHGYRVTLISVPIDWSEAGLDPRVDLRVGPGSEGVEAKLAGVKRSLPRPAFRAAKHAWYALRGGPSRGFARYAETLLPNEPIDLIHAHDLDTLEAAITIRDRHPDAKVIYDAHELYPYQVHDPMYQRYWSNVERRLIQHADGIMTVSRSFAEQLERLYGVRDVRVVHNAFGSGDNAETCTRHAFLDHFGIDPSDPRAIVVFQGGQSADRGLEDLVRAFGLVGDAAILCLLGSGELHGTLRAIVGDLNNDAVRFAEPVSQARLIGMLRHADLGVIPYPDAGLLNNTYCSPNKLFEFIEAGVPICASDLPEIRRVVTSSGIGDVFDMTSPERMAGAVSDMIRRLRAGEFEPGGFHRARETYGWGSQERVLLDLYSALGPDPHPPEPRLD